MPGATTAFRGRQRVTGEAGVAGGARLLGVALAVRHRHQRMDLDLAGAVNVALAALLRGRSEKWHHNPNDLLKRVRSGSPATVMVVFVFCIVRPTLILRTNTRFGRWLNRF
jgi:hypothetical protein